MGSRPLPRSAMHGDRDHTPAGLPVVIGVAPTLADRVRLAELLDGFGPVGLVLVSTIDEARLLLDSAVPGTGTEAGTGAEPPPDPPEGERLIQLAGVTISSDRLLARHNGHQVGLTPLEHDLLICLGSPPQRTWTHAALHEAVWNTRHAGGRADIHSVVKRLRRKLAALGASASIEAVRGVGFRLQHHPGAAPQSA